MKYMNIKNKIYTTTILLSILSLVVFALPAQAQTSTTKAMAKLLAQSDKEISQRLDSLNKLLTRVQELKRVSDSEKSSIVSQIQTQISEMNTLKTKIDSDADTTSLKADLKSITANYRIYALVVPQTQIIAAADRLNALAADFSIVISKLQTRISALQNTGKNIAGIQTTLSNLQSKVADAQVQAQAAINRVTPLLPDQGDKTILKSNTAALKLSRADIKVGLLDIQTSRKDAQIIIKNLRTLSPSATSSASTTAQ